MRSRRQCDVGKERASNGAVEWYWHRVTSACSRGRGQRLIQRPDGKAADAGRHGKDGTVLESVVRRLISWSSHNLAPATVGEPRPHA